MWSEEETEGDYACGLIPVISWDNSAEGLVSRGRVGSSVGRSQLIRRITGVM